MFETRSFFRCVLCCMFLSSWHVNIFSDVASSEHIAKLPYTHLIDDNVKWIEVRDSSEKARIFSLIYQSARSNLESIKTWQGKYTVRVFDCINSPPFTKTRGVISFSLDMKNDLLNWKHEVDDCFVWPLQTSTKWEKSSQKAAASGFQHIYLANKTLSLFSLLPISGKIDLIPDFPISNQKIASVTDGQSVKRSPLSQISDPRFFFCNTNNKDWRTYWDKYPTIVKNLNDGNVANTERTNARYSVYISESENNVFYKIEEWTPSRNYKLSEIVYSGQHAFCPIEKSGFFPKNDLITRVVWTWKNENGVFIPDNYSTYFSHGSGLIQYELVEAKVNQPIADECFTYRGLGLEERDLLLDDIEKTVYIVTKDGDKKVLCKYGEPPVLVYEQRYLFLRRLFQFLGIVLILLGIFLKIRARVCKV